VDACRAVGPNVAVDRAAELVVPSGTSVWTASLLHALTGPGMNEQTARQTITRAVAGGWLTTETRVRVVRLSPTPAVVEAVEEIIERVASLIDMSPGWDGRCLILSVTIGTDHRNERKRLYAALALAGFGNPAPGLWMTPIAIDQRTRRA
jgi:phenylacetic acid degradation operon negative regulatory protein